MKHLLMAILLSSCASLAAGAPAASPHAKARGQQVVIKIGSTSFAATLEENPTVTAFKALLPLTIKMADLNGNEKHVDLAKALPTRATNPGTIKSGDLMLYGSRTFVIFYESFTTTYSYTRLGRIEDPKGLAAALGSGNVTVTIESK